MRSKAHAALAAPLVLHFSKNLRACLFDDDLSNDPEFGRIHLAGQYTLKVYKISCLFFSVCKNLSRST
jgi:hypothetical protein